MSFSIDLCVRHIHSQHKQTFTDSSFSITRSMVKFTVQSDGMLAVTGKTYDHRGSLKEMGGRWDKFNKSWVVSDTPENKKILKTLTTKRRCGHCGETGHFKPNCPAYHEERKKDIRMKANALWNKRPKNYERLKHTGFCHCMFEPESFGYKDFTVLMPNVCGVCSNWCCEKARPMDKDFTVNFNTSRFVCPSHGDCFEQIMNDTRGT